MLIFIVLLGVVAILLISNTIRLSIFARKREVEIMKLVGATNWFIRWPFLIEGITVGFFGALAAAVVVLVLSNYLLGKLQHSLSWLAVPMDAVPYVTIASCCWQWESSSAPPVRRSGSGASSRYEVKPLVGSVSRGALHRS